MQAEIVMDKRHAAMSAQERLQYLADDLESYSPCPYSRDVLESWLTLQLASGRLGSGDDAGRLLDIAYEDWINPDDNEDD
ncbi:hypothetical protein [Pseudomonas frederiksbergensis]|uniref:hypothetical protein n=1 Tax=Pseudomonas frederiksbergensis TaxID=104087 RepID=UPI003D190169